MRLGQLNGLVAFLAVADKRGFSAASRALGVSPSALSQAVRGLEARMGTPLLVRTTRSVNLTEAGRRLRDRVGPAMQEALAGVEEVQGGADHVSGTLRLTVPRIAVPLVIEPVLPGLLARHPELSVDVSVDNRNVDIVADGYDAGVRLSESVEKEMVAVRVTPPFRFVMVGSPAYLARKGRPKRPKDLLEHDCIGFRRSSSGQRYAWELEKGGREYRIAVQGPFITDDAALMVSAARWGAGLAYVNEQVAADDLKAGTLEEVLEGYGPSVPGFFLYFPARAQRLPKLRVLLDAMTARLPRKPARGAS
ncbi:LysR family transcriptional regulator [Corallococcus sp. CA053C]|uniref:LysR family transcriptional regulator n=1 Tax=Corallococcus sp. CA053C TaxID=2316732 RepID=UPI001F442817|nr:LysR family transcriptional regulator [Corallococcus sp. CA053C]